MSHREHKTIIRKINHTTRRGARGESASSSFCVYSSTTNLACHPATSTLPCPLSPYRNIPASRHPLSVPPLCAPHLVGTRNEQLLAVGSRTYVWLLHARTPSPLGKPTNRHTRTTASSHHSSQVRQRTICQEQHHRQQQAPRC